MSTEQPSALSDQRSAPSSRPARDDSTPVPAQGVDFLYDFFGNSEFVVAPVTR